MKIVDINVMIGPDTVSARYNTASGLLSYLDSYRITSAVVYHNASRMNPGRYNREMSRISIESSGRIQACHVLDPILEEKNNPENGSLEERLRVSRPAAVRMLPNSQNYPLDSFFCGRTLGALNELRIPLLLDAKELPPIEDIPHLAREFPDIPIVILRYGFVRIRSLAPLLSKLDNIFTDIHMLVNTGVIEDLVNNYCGSKKLLFGSGLPNYSPAGVLAMVLYSPLDSVHKENILHANWERIQGGIRYDNKR